MYSSARLAQSVEYETLNLGVVGSSPTLGDFFVFLYILYLHLLCKGLNIGEMFVKPFSNYS